jgi:plasmid segregation protein ParM
MIISIDSGNKNIKTDNFVFPSALSESTIDLGIGRNILEYQGIFYSLDGERIKYMRDKTVDDRFFILTLFGIAKEIEKKAVEGKIKLGNSNTYSITLLNGLPPKHLAQAEKFREYFLKKEIISFTYNNVKYNIKFNDVFIFPQAYAAAATMKKKIVTEDEVLIVDIGGYTLDYMLLTNGQYNMHKCETLENGIILLYNEITNHCLDQYDIILNEKKIDALLDGPSKIKIPGVMEYAQAKARSFVNEFIHSLREQKNDLRTIPVIFVGGGSLTLKKYIEENPMIMDATFVDDVKANAKGYRLLYRMKMKQQKAR